jgi:hypothetical protein
MLTPLICFVGLVQKRVAEFKNDIVKAIPVFCYFGIPNIKKNRKTKRTPVWPALLSILLAIIAILFPHARFRGRGGITSFPLPLSNRNGCFLPGRFLRWEGFDPLPKIRYNQKLFSAADIRFTTAGSDTTPSEHNTWCRSRAACLCNASRLRGRRCRRPGPASYLL